MSHIAFDTADDNRFFVASAASSNNDAANENTLLIRFSMLRTIAKKALFEVTAGSRTSNFSRAKVRGISGSARSGFEASS
jgi:hypothetical protein